MESLTEQKDGTELPSNDSAVKTQLRGSKPSSDDSCSPQFGWPIGKTGNYLKVEGKIKPHLNVESGHDKSGIKKQGSKSSGQFNFVDISSVFWDCLVNGRCGGIAPFIFAINLSFMW